METVKNKVQLTGTLSRDPQVNKFSNGKKWASVSLMISEHYQNRLGEHVHNNQFHPLKAFGKNAEQLEKECSKGTKLFVEGKLASRTYIDKEGKKKYVTEVEVSSITILEKQEQMSHLQ